MKIVSCYVDRSEIAPLVKAGADELYTSARGLPSFTQAALPGLADLRAAIKEIHSLGARASVALNSMGAARNEAGMRALVAHARELDRAGADALIISAPSIMSLLRREAPGLRAELHLSSVQPCFNSAALRFFLRFGIKRLILPSQLAPREAAGLFRACARAGVATEIFDYRFFGCVYVNGRCSLHAPRFHTLRRGFDGGMMCRRGAGSGPLPAKPFDVRPGMAAGAAAAARRVALRMGGGGAPRLYNAATFYDFTLMGADWLKYGTRLDPAPLKARKVRAMKEMIGLAQELAAKRGAGGRDAFVERMTRWRL